MDIFDAPKPKRAKKPFSLAALAKKPPQDPALVRQIKAALDKEAVKRLEAYYMALDNPIHKATYWERIGRVAGWIELPEALYTRDQFGDQPERDKGDRHKVRWRHFTGNLVGVMGTLFQWQREAKGSGRGWFPVPGEREWDECALWIAGTYGVYLYPVDRMRHEAVVADGGLCVSRDDGDASCLFEP